jgi:hypothetical protein
MRSSFIHYAVILPISNLLTAALSPEFSEDISQRSNSRLICFRELAGHRVSPKNLSSSSDEQSQKTTSGASVTNSFDSDWHAGVKQAVKILFSFREAESYRFRVSLVSMQKYHKHNSHFRAPIFPLLITEKIIN